MPREESVDDVHFFETGLSTEAAVKQRSWWALDRGMWVRDWLKWIAARLLVMFGVLDVVRSLGMLWCF